MFLSKSNTNYIIRNLDKMKKITLLCLMATMSFGAFAQDLDEERVALSTTVDSVYTTEIVNPSKYTVETNPFGHNWFINAGAGMNMFFGDHTSKMKNLWDHSSWIADLSFGKWFTPGIGVRIGANIGNTTGMSAWTGNKGGIANINNHQGFIVYNENNQPEIYAGQKELSGVGYTTYKTREQFLVVGADVMFNLSNMLWGYKADRIYSFIPYFGVGYAMSLNEAHWYLDGKREDYGRRTGLISFNGGILNKFRLSKHFDFNIDIKAQFTGDQFDQQWFSKLEDNKTIENGAGRIGEGILSATLGFTYNILPGWQKGVHTTIRVNDNVLSDLNNRLADLDKLNSDLRSQLESALNREVTKENVAAQPLLVTFQIDRWKLSTKDRVNLGFLAEVIKANPDVVYSVTGFADKGTGSVKRNIFLAKKRAVVVYNALVNEFGVSENQLRKDSKGGVANMYYNDPRNSRAVLMKVAE